MVINIEIIEDKKVKRYKSKIMDLSEDTILIDYPTNIETNKTLYLMNGSQVNVSFVDELTEQAYQFSTFVIGKKKENIPLIIISKPHEEDYVRIQRREFVRIKWPVDVAIHSITNEFAPFRTITDDISAGGASILVSTEIPIYKQQQVLVWFVLPRKTGEYNYLKINCEIVRIISLNDQKNIVSLKFLNKGRLEEQTLLQFCYEVQVALRKKEKNI